MLGAISYDPIVKIGFVSPHGIGIAVGFLLGAKLMMPAAKRRGIGEDDIYSFLTRAAIGSLVGARLAYVINHYQEYDSIIDVFRVWEGGISLLGGFLGAIAFALPEMRKRKVSFWKAMDSAAPGMALGVIIGRIGDLIVGDHLGTVTDFFLGYRCPPFGVETASPCVAGPGGVVHQTALYDFLLTAFLLTVLLLIRRRPHYDGFLITVFGAMYGVNRLIEDFLHEDVRRLGLTGSQWTAVTFLTLCSLHLLFVRKTPRWGRWDGGPRESTPIVSLDGPGHFDEGAPVLVGGGSAPPPAESTEPAEPPSVPGPSDRPVEPPTMAEPPAPPEE